MSKKLGPCICDLCNVHCHYTFTYSSATDSYTFIASCHGELDRCVVKIEDLIEWDFNGLRAFTGKNTKKNLLNLSSTSPMEKPHKEPLLCLEYKSRKESEPSARPVGTSPFDGGIDKWRPSVISL